MKQQRFRQLGFVLLFSGFLLTALFNSSRLLQIIGLVLIVTSSALFGAATGSKCSLKK